VRNLNFSFVSITYIAPDSSAAAKTAPSGRKQRLVSGLLKVVISLIILPLAGSCMATVRLKA